MTKEQAEQVIAEEESNPGTHTISKVLRAKIKAKEE